MLLASACSPSTAGQPSDSGGGAPLEAAVRDLAAADSGSGDAAPFGDAGCNPGSGRCLSLHEEERCLLTADGPAWVAQSCPAGNLCLETSCAADCRDQCTLDETREVSGAIETCRLFLVAAADFVSADQGLHSRSRAYNAWMRRWHLPAGQVYDVFFSDTSYTQVASYGGVGDAAIWTGTYLAAEALRLLASGAPDAEASVRRLVEATHDLFAVTGAPGALARFTAPLDHPDPAVLALYHPEDPSHFVSSYKGRSYF